MQGYRVTHAPEARKALELLTNAHRFDVVLLDVMLPDRSGFEVLEEMRRRGLETPVLVLTGRGEREQVLQGFGLGADDYIVKPSTRTKWPPAYGPSCNERNRPTGHPCRSTVSATWRSTSARTKPTAAPSASTSRPWS
nr:response regulator [Rhodothermus marinus]